tara:strand:+ start:179 stop:337 length:159 start_codon:yes stop_codon:yes gene_type:complete
MKSFLIDYHLTEGKNDIWDTVEISAENYHDAEHEFHEQISGDAEILSIFWQD